VLAVSAWFDQAAEAAICELWRKMAEAGVDDSLRTDPYRPHLTLGVWENVSVKVASTHAATAVSGRPTFAVQFRAIGIFPHPVRGDSRRYAAVWLCPTVTPALRDAHEKVHAGIPAERGALARYTPGRWNPHCTLAQRLTPQQALTAAEVVMRANVLPLTAAVTRFGLIDTPAGIELGAFPLAG
jgi:2'-5' RNA ligase